MGTMIRAADLVTDRDSALRLFTQHLNSQYDLQRFFWLYSANPAGQGRLWLAIDDKTGETIGTAAAFPRLVSIYGTEATAWVLGDFCVAERYRTLGPALALQRACVGAVTAGPAAFYYDFPNRKLVPVYTRLGLGLPRPMWRLVKLLRVDAQVNRFVRPPTLARGVAAATNAMLRVHGRLLRGLGDTVFSVLKERCAEEFSILDRKVSSEYGLCVRRSSEYLNWRYLSNPIRRHEVLTARRNGELAAWVVFTEDASAGTIVDAFGDPDPELIGATVQATVSVLRSRGCHSAAVSLLDSHPWISLFRRLGFSLRETSPVFIGAASGLPVSPEVLLGTDVFLMQGDNDS